jgi:NAD(P)-dependent dehydrogenase (short-subunit alcohol dehydrogenase family)
VSGASDASTSVLVAGGTKGIGLAIATRLARPGTHVFLNYHADEAAAARAAAAVQARGATAHLVRQDVGRRDGAAATIAAVQAVTDRLDVLVHSSAVPNPGMLGDQDLDSVRHALDVGGLALLYLVQPALELLGPGSSVIFLSGNSVDLVLPGHGALAAAKAYGECVVRYLAIELAPRGINVNTLRTGPVDTDLLRSVRTTAAPLPATPNGRRLTVEDIAEAAAFLVSPAASMIRGQALMVDGGLNTTVRGA